MNTSTTSCQIFVKRKLMIMRCAVLWLVVLLHRSKKEGPWLNSQPVIFLHRAFVLSRCFCGFLTQSKNMTFRLISLSKLSSGVCRLLFVLCVCIVLKWTRELYRVYPASRSMFTCDRHKPSLPQSKNMT